MRHLQMLFFVLAGLLWVVPVSAQECGWSGMGQELSGAVNAFSMFDEGDGPRLFAGGNFTNSGGKPLERIARWDGERWTPMPGFNSTCHSLAVFDDGSGPALFAG